MPYITRIIQTDSRYISEKEARKQENKEKQKSQKRIYAQSKREKEKQDYQKLLVQINNDNKFLSTKRQVSDEKYAKWNRSAYDYDKNTGDLILKDKIVAGFNVAKRVSNIVNPNSIKSNRIYVQLVCFELVKVYFFRSKLKNVKCVYKKGTGIYI